MVTKLLLNLSHILDVEHRIAPPMRQAITVPVTIGASEIIVYIATTQFPRRGLEITDAQLIELVGKIVERLKDGD